jgi:hypothetical protein
MCSDNVHFNVSHNAIIVDQSVLFVIRVLSVHINVTSAVSCVKQTNPRFSKKIVLSKMSVGLQN